MITKRMPVHISSQEEPKLVKRTARCPAGTKWVVAKISTTTVDADGDVLVPGGCDFSEFKRNPVVFFAHDAGTLPIGRVIGIKPAPTEIVAKVEFARRPESLPEAQEWVPDTIHDLMRQDMLKGFSIGADIMPGGARPAQAADVPRFGAGVRRVVTRWKLKELSVVPLPANPDAMAMAISKGVLKAGSWVHEQLSCGPALDVPPARLVISPQMPRLALRPSQA